MTGLLSVFVGLLSVVTPPVFAYGEQSEPVVILVEAFPTELRRIADCESGKRNPDGSAVEGSATHYDADGNIIIGRNNAPELGVDIGKYQINSVFHGARAKELGLSLYDERENERYALLLYKEQGNKPWSASRKCWSRD